MQFSCESCKTQLQIADEKVRGKRLIVRCKRCGAKIAISDPALGAARPKLVAGPAASASAPPASAPPPPAAAPAIPLARDSDTDSTRAMDSDLLEQALQASKVDEPQQGAAPARPAPAARSAPPPAEPTDAPLWFAMLHGKQQGPLTRAELAARTDDGAIGPRTYLWKDGMDAWQRAKDLPELQGLFPQLPETPSLPPPLAPPPAAAPPAAALREFSSPDFLARAQPPAPQAAAPATKPAPVEEEPTAVDPLPLGERVHQEDVGRALFTPDQGSVQKPPADLASWAAGELEKKSAPPRPAVTPAPRMFEGAAAPGGRGPFVLVVLGVVAVAAVVLWLVFESGARAPPPAQNGEEARAAAPPPVSPVTTVPGPGPAAPTGAPSAATAPKADKPAARAEARPEPSTGLTADQVRRKLDENKGALQGCIDEALRRDPNLRVGKIHIATTIAPTGAVTQAKIDKNTVDQSPLGACLRRATRKIAFPAFSGEAFDVDIPIVVTAGE